MVAVACRLIRSPTHGKTQNRVPSTRELGPASSVAVLPWDCVSKAHSNLCFRLCYAIRYGDCGFVCKLCKEELSNVYMHCDGCEKLLNKDFNICQEFQKTQYPYRQALGLVGYLANNTRPDLQTAYSILAMYQEHPTEPHVEGMKSLLRYIAGTLDLEKTNTQCSATLHLP